MSKYVAALAIFAAGVSAQQLTNTANSQAEDCLPMPFKKPSELIPGTRLQSPEGHKFDFSEYPNIEWEDVPDKDWSFDETNKDAPYPLGYRRANLNYELGAVMCLKIPKEMAQHKIEVSVEAMNRGTICISDTRKGQMNHMAANLVTACDNDGQLTTCFSTLVSGGYTSENNPGQTAYDQGTMDANGNLIVNGAAVDVSGNQKVPLYDSEEFAVAIGCRGNGCTEGSDSLLFYRVRASKMTWTKSQNSAEGNLDMWCMMMAQRNPDFADGTSVDAIAGGAADFATGTPGMDVEAELGDKKMNMVPQMYPTDLWAPANINPDEDDPAGAAGLGDNKIPGERVNTGSAASVAASVVAVALPLIALLF